MSTSIAVLTKNHNLLLELGRHLEGQRPIVPCETVESLRERLAAEPVGAVLAHMDSVTLHGHSPSGFVAELGEAVGESTLLALLDRDCPPRLRRLAERAADELLEMPLDYGHLHRLLAPPADLEVELAGLCSGMPHKELRGRTRSLVTFTPEMFEMMDEIQVAARHHVTALLIGETGCGKTFLARLIHELSDRRDERFCTVACGALPPDLIESELFGYVKGAFTGADKNREGKFAAAGRGTLLLDEIDVLLPEQQAKLLRVIETGEYEPVGSNETQFSQARLIVASNYNLEELVRGGTFRTDLYYRLNILNFRMLPLRERPWDIEYLARKLALEHSRTHSIQIRSIEPEFFDALRRYPWPGNVREMENVIRRAVLYCQRGVLSVGDLPSSIRTGSSPSMYPASWSCAANETPAPSARFQTPLFAGRSLLPTSQADRLPFPGLNHPYRADANSRRAESVSSATATVEPACHPSLEARVDVLERRIIEDCLARNNFRRKETAAELGISRVTLYNKMKKFGLM